MAGGGREGIPEDFYVEQAICAGCGRPTVRIGLPLVDLRSDAWYQHVAHTVREEVNISAEEQSLCVQYVKEIWEGRKVGHVIRDADENEVEVMGAYPDQLGGPVVRKMFPIFNRDELDE